MLCWSARSRPPRRLGLGLAALLVASVVALSCSKKQIVVGPIDGLEGVLSASQMIVWPETPNLVETYDDLGEPGPSFTSGGVREDTLLSVENVYLTGPGTVRGMIFDFTDAERFEVFRSEPDGYRRLKDYDLQPAKRFLQSQTDLFAFTDQRPGPVALQNYVGRGVVAGTTTQQSPKTNIGHISRAAVAGDLDYAAPTGFGDCGPPPFRPCPDSLLFMEWEAYAGSGGYWVHVYQFTNQGGSEIIASGIPAPLYLAVTRDYFLAYFPASVTSYRIGDPVPAGGRIVTQRALLNNQLYMVRVAAVDANGQLIAYTGSSGSKQVFRQEETYQEFPLGARVINTKTPVPTPTPTGPLRLGPVAGGRAEAWIYPAGTPPKRSP